MVAVYRIHPDADMDHIGFLPLWLNENDPRPAKEQLNEHYAHGGGWRPFDGFKLEDNLSIAYPGDPAHPALAVMRLRKELIVVYEFSWVAIIQPDNSYEICRMD